MIRLSSNTTLFWKMFVPTGYIAFFGLLALVILLSKDENLAVFNDPLIIGGYLAVYTLFVALLYFTLMSLKRVEAGKTHFMATNYFKTYQYTYDSIDRVKTYDMIVFKLGSIHLNKKGKFGKKIRFIVNRSGLTHFEQSHPNIFSKVFSN